MMIILHIKRWPFQPAKSVEDEIAGGQYFALDDISFPQTVRYFPQVHRQLPLWYGEQSEALPQLALDDTNVQPRVIWPQSQPLALSQHDDGVPPIAPTIVDDDSWVKPTPWMQHIRGLAASVDDDVLPIAPPITIVDDDGVIVTRPWVYVPPLPLLWFDNETTLSLPYAFLDETSQWVFSQWVRDTPIPLYQTTDDIIPIIVTPTLDDEGKWSFFQWPTDLNPTVVQRTDDIIPFASVVDDDSQWRWQAPWLSLSQQYVWSVEDERVTPPSPFSLYEDTYTPPAQWCTWYTPILWYGEEEYPTPAVPFFLHDETWVGLVQPTYPIPQFYFSGIGIDDLLVSTDTLYIVELNIIPSVDGTVQLQAYPANAATLVTIRQGSLGFMKEVL